MKSEKLSYWKVYRLIFVIFFLYLLGDAFYRWDGFSYHSTFSEFLLSVALISIILSVLAALITLLIILLPICLPFKAFQWFILRLGHKVKAEQLHLFIFIFLSLSATVWLGKRLTIHYDASWQLKVFVLFCIAIVALISAWLLRRKAQRWIDSIVGSIKGLYILTQERIAPLVWIFVLWVFISLFLVTYQTWFKGTDEVRLQEVMKISANDESRPNIILVTFDALTTRHMSVYGYHRETTPFITEWAKGASVFTRAEAAGNYTAFTTASLMTGKRVWSHRRFSRMGSSRPIGNDIENIPFLLKKYGYFNMAFIVNPIATVEKLQVSAFFDISVPPAKMRRVNNKISYVIGSLSYFLDSVFGKKIKLSQWIFKKDFFIFHKLLSISQHNIEDTQSPPEMAFNKFLNILNNTTQRPFFVWIHLLPPHSPYLPPKPFKGMFDPSDEMKTLGSVSKAFFESKESISKYKSVPENFKTLVARYDEFIRYCDKQFEDFILNLRKVNNIKNTIILLSSDHGEIFSHKGLGHGDTLYESETNIPLIIKAPDRFDGRLINELVEQIDIPATILDVTNIPVPLWMEGRSLVPIMNGEPLHSRPGFSMNLEKSRSSDKITKGIIAVWDGDHKLIHHIKDQKSLLFNLRYDSDEMYNLFDKEPEVGKRLLTLIQGKIKELNGRIREN